MSYLTSDLRREGSRWLHGAIGHIYLLALACLPCFLPESNSHVGLGRGQGPELAAIQWARSSNSSTVEMLFMHPHKNSWRPALHSRPEVCIQQNRAFESSPKNPGKVPYELWSKMCRCADPSSISFLPFLAVHLVRTHLHLWRCQSHLSRT